MPPRKLRPLGLALEQAAQQSPRIIKKSAAEELTRYPKSDHFGQKAR